MQLRVLVARAGSEALPQDRASCIARLRRRGDRRGRHLRLPRLRRLRGRRRPGEETADPRTAIPKALEGAARTAYALARDAGGTRGLSCLAPGGAPVAALVACSVVVLAVVLGLRTTGAAVLDATSWALTVGTISLLAAYALATVGAIRSLSTRGVRRAPAWQVVVPVLGLALVAHTVYRNAVGLEPPDSWSPGVVAAWLAVGLAVVALAPGIAGRVAASLRRADDAAVTR